MSKVTAKYQITIPPEIRRETGITPGTEVKIIKKGTDIVLVAKPFEALKRKWRGKFKEGAETTDEYMNKIRGKVS